MTDHRARIGAAATLAAYRAHKATHDSHVQPGCDVCSSYICALLTTPTRAAHHATGPRP